MKETIRHSVTFTIPANSAVNVPIIIEFEHSNDSRAPKVFAIGFAEISNPLNKHYNIGFNVIKGNQSIYPTSKKFIQAGETTNLSERFVPFEFDRPSDNKSYVVIIPTEATGNQDIVCQFAVKYTDQ